jgi:site-specific DNA-methyltransferase (adenine-specific)
VIDFHEIVSKGGPWQRAEIIGDALLLQGDCREILPVLPSVDAVISDPPYGMKWDGKVSRGKNGTGKKGETRHYGRTIVDDDKPFDPSPWIGFKHVVLWGWNHYASRLDVGTTLVWLKRYDSGFGSFLSDGEVAWMKGGHGVYAYRDVSLQGDSDNRAHPTQKPVGLMAWSMDRAKVPNKALVLDPYMGSGSTGVACIDTGRQFIGIEIEKNYFEASCTRIRQAQAQLRLFA